jgi:hypothetical protein
MSTSISRLDLTRWDERMSNPIRMGAFWEKKSKGCRYFAIGMGVFLATKKLQWSRATQVTIVPSVIADLADGLPELKIFETLEGSIKKIETLGGRIENRCQLPRVGVGG